MPNSCKMLTIRAKMADNKRLKEMRGLVVRAVRKEEREMKEKHVTESNA